MLELIEITDSIQQEAMEYKEEFILNQEIMHGGAGLDSFDTFYDWLSSITDNSNVETIRPNRVLATTYFARRDEDGKLVGIIDIRHTLNDFLLNFGGHIGYSVRKSERQKGYAKEMLGLALNKCRSWGMDRVLITCDKVNPASSKTILAHGGVLENEVPHDGVILQRYWIEL
ncbi:MAG: GNAT family N-acetyltransferase [Erysipelotrichales bacterium]|nr:MAG: GNAT family N-acetyltransferase [Erysipelotrichales bacterium]